MAEGNGLENRRRVTVREFESLLLRHHFSFSPCFPSLLSKRKLFSMPSEMLHLIRCYQINLLEIGIGNVSAVGSPHSQRISADIGGYDVKAKTDRLTISQWLSAHFYRVRLLRQKYQNDYR